MRLHLKNLDPEIHGLISQHKAECCFSNLDETVSSLVRLAMVNYPKKVRELQEIIQTLGEYEDRKNEGSV